jgi:acylphosphatase
MLKQVHVYIKGDVIGVGFRAWCKIQAKMNNVSGWVRNVYDRPEVFGVEGGVEALIQGDEQNVSLMVETIKKGPPVARVEAVEVFWQDPKEVFEGFNIVK